MDDTKNNAKKMVYDNELDEEIKKAQAHLYYLRNRKKTGYPGGKVTKNPHVRGKEDNEKSFYKENIKDFKFTNKYNEYREEMLVASKRFVSFHNKVFKLVHKYGTEQEKEAFEKLSSNM